MGSVKIMEYAADSSSIHGRSHLKHLGSTDDFSADLADEPTVGSKTSNVVATSPEASLEELNCPLESNEVKYMISDLVEDDCAVEANSSSTNGQQQSMDLRSKKKPAATTSWFSAAVKPTVRRREQPVLQMTNFFQSRPASKSTTQSRQRGPGNGKLAHLSATHKERKVTKVATKKKEPVMNLTGNESGDAEINQLPAVSVNVGGILGDNDSKKDFDDDDLNSLASVTFEGRATNSDEELEDFGKSAAESAVVGGKRKLAATKTVFPVKKLSAGNQIHRGFGLADSYRMKNRAERRRTIMQYFVGEGEKDILVTANHFKALGWPYKTVRNFLQHFEKTGTVTNRPRSDCLNYTEIGDKLLQLFNERGDKYSGKEAVIELGISKNAYWRVCEKHEGFKKALSERNLEAELVNEAKRSAVIEKFLAADGDYRERRNACVRYFWKTPGFYQTFVFETVDRFVRTGSIRSNDRTKQSTWSSADAHGALLKLTDAEERYVTKVQAAQNELKTLLNVNCKNGRRKSIAGIDADKLNKDLADRNTHLEQRVAQAEADRDVAKQEAVAVRAELDQWKAWATRNVTAAGQQVIIQPSSQQAASSAVQLTTHTLSPASANAAAVVLSSSRSTLDARVRVLQIPHR